MDNPELVMPGWVDAANRRLRRRRRPAVVDDWPAPPLVGELRVAEEISGQQARQRLVCVLGVDHGSGAARVALVTNEVEMASRGDLVIPASGCGLPFDLLVEGRVTGTLWWIQLSRRLGQLDDHWTALLQRANQDGHGGGPPTDWPRSSRGVLRAFQREETQWMRALAGDCESTLVQGVRAVPVVVDPRLFAGRREQTTPLRVRRMLAIAGELMGTGTAVVPGAGVAEALEVCEAARDFAPDLETALRPLLEGTLSHHGGGSAEEGVAFELGPGRVQQKADGPLAATLASLVAARHGSVHLVTDRKGWPDGDAVTPGALAARCGHRRRVQIVRRFLEVQP